ncbi:hypothetical protein PNEG_04284 [Pneumocystis murina B123]|uniref:Uncharacterized protein n=1 Tax=Pneumocystis murina (strain B123) TaxID=1069680 RepID=A0A0W4ZX17_PNEMU|nr:hypothetical protein PNEG_04284 [Pneumocystis murina B123]KTW32915.1 hypothetical protein PNEG_04284 [Pneumocystis murina B123]
MLSDCLAVIKYILIDFLNILQIFCLDLIFVKKLHYDFYYTFNYFFNDLRLISIYRIFNNFARYYIVYIFYTIRFPFLLYFGALRIHSSLNF